MPWYQPLECDKTVKKPLVCDTSNFDEFGFVEKDFKSGLIVNEWPDGIYFKASQKKYDGSPDDVLQNGYMIPVYSEKLMNELLKADIKGIQYLPINVLSFKGNTFNSFYVANFLNYVEALDYEESDFNRFDDDFPNPNVRGKIAGIKRYVLKQKEIETFDIIRLKDYYQSFFVSEKFVKIFEMNNFTGYSFLEIDTV